MALSARAVTLGQSGINCVLRRLVEEARTPQGETGCVVGFWR